MQGKTSGELTSLISLCFADLDWPCRIFCPKYCSTPAVISPAWQVAAHLADCSCSKHSRDCIVRASVLHQMIRLPCFCMRLTWSNWL